MASIMLCKILPFRNPSFSALMKRNKKTTSLNNRTSAANFGIDIDCILSTPFLATADNSDYENSEKCSSYKFPSVTKILEESRSEDGRQILIKWKQAMIEQLGTEIFEKMTADRFKLGHSLHEAFTMQYLTLNTPPDEVILPDNAKPYWNSMRPLLEDFDNLISKEMWVNHRKLCFKGQLDAVAHYKKKLTLIELKTSDKLKLRLENTYDTPLQLAAYAGALNSMNLDYKVTHAVIVVCYKDNQASVFELGPRYLEYYWKEWLQQLFYSAKWISLKKKNLNRSQKKSSLHPEMNEKISSLTNIGFMSRTSSFNNTALINFYNLVWNSSCRCESDQCRRVGGFRVQRGVQRGNWDWCFLCSYVIG
ncbi:Mitochondrial genome maintenance exonuclease 1 [Trichinella pseudospiralis]|uniref:Mitochondrial genome maintenance exonuclease 1 n=1 Tax=Trichinella pseudospiralis TaxID=6337 RepID=A0A0V1IGX8_TRIPS|nr:Mitochondrial genome maintenance exonuclease 1 [Trichinella pseudospiralis]